MTTQDNRKKFEIGDRVQGGRDSYFDIGTVAAAPHHAYPIHDIRDAVWVSWDSGVASWAPADLIERDYGNFTY